MRWLIKRPSDTSPFWKPWFAWRPVRAVVAPSCIPKYWVWLERVGIHKSLLGISLKGYARYQYDYCIKELLCAQKS